MAGKLLGHVQEQVGYLKVCGLGGLSGEALAGALDKAKVSIIMGAATAELVTPAKATEIFNLLFGSPFAMTQRSEIIAAVNANVGSPSSEGGYGAGSTRVKLQSCLTFHRILPKKLWTVLLDSRTPYNQKLQAVGKWCDLAGLVNANEPTYAHIVAVMALASQHDVHETDFRVDLAQSYQVGLDLKAFIKCFRKKVKLAHHGAIKVYPATAAELETLHLEIYQKIFAGLDDESKPMESPLDEATLLQLRARIPCRRTNQSLVIRGRPMPWQLHLQQQQQQLPQQQQQQRNLDLPSLRIFGPSGGATAYDLATARAMVLAVDGGIAGTIACTPCIKA
jgi:hypothetical protein